MDTLTHALSGAIVGRLLATRRSRVTAPATATPSTPDAPLPVWQCVAAGAAAATFPDLDFILGYVSELTYLRGHRGVTHSLVLLPLWGLLLAWLFGRLARRSRPGTDWRAFYAIACAGILIHIAGDLITQFGTMILAPFSDRRFGWGTTFIIDLVMTGLLVAGLTASAVWRQSRIPAATALVLVIGWVGVGAVGRSEAIAAARAWADTNGVTAVMVDAAPRPASPFNWTAIVFDGERYHFAHLNTRRTEALGVSPDDHFIRRFSAPYQPVALAHWHTRARFGSMEQADLAQAVWQASDFAFYRWFAMFPVLDHVAGESGGRRCAGFRDLRFEIPGRLDAPFRFGLCSDLGASAWHLYKLATDGQRLMID